MTYGCRRTGQTQPGTDGDCGLVYSIIFRDKPGGQEKEMVRQKIIHCGRGTKTYYREIDIHMGKRGQGRKGKRGPKTMRSLPKQERLNFRNSQRHLHQLCKCNFMGYDYRLDLTYNDRWLPASLEMGQKLVDSYLRKVNARRKKKGLSPARWICVDEGFDGNGRPHHHLLISGGLDRDTMESLWYTGRGKNAESLGMASTETLKFNNGGIEGLIKYITKQALKDYKSRGTEGQLSLADLGGDVAEEDIVSPSSGSRRRWRQSKNLIQPHEKINDHAYSRKDIIRLVRQPADCGDTKKYYENKYKGYVLDTCRNEYNEVTGTWSIYLTMHRKDKDTGPGRGGGKSGRRRGTGEVMTT